MLSKMRLKIKIFSLTLLIHKFLITPNQKRTQIKILFVIIMKYNKNLKMIIVITHKKKKENNIIINMILIIIVILIFLTKKIIFMKLKSMSHKIKLIKYHWKNLNLILIKIIEIISKSMNITHILITINQNKLKPALVAIIIVYIIALLHTIMKLKTKTLIWI